MITVSEKYLLFSGINLIALSGLASYYLLRWTSGVALQLAEIAAPNYESGLYILILFGDIFIVISITIAILFDAWWLYKIVRKSQKEYWKENL